MALLGLNRRCSACPVVYLWLREKRWTQARPGPIHDGLFPKDNRGGTGAAKVICLKSDRFTRRERSDPHASKGGVNFGKSIFDFPPGLVSPGELAGGMDLANPWFPRGNWQFARVNRWFLRGNHSYRAETFHETHSRDSPPLSFLLLPSRTQYHGLPEEEGRKWRCSTRSEGGCDFPGGKRFNTGESQGNLPKKGLSLTQCRNRAKGDEGPPRFLFPQTHFTRQLKKT